jgi:hypothetical protein
LKDFTAYGASRPPLPPSDMTPLYILFGLIIGILGFVSWKLLQIKMPEDASEKLDLLQKEFADTKAQLHIKMEELGQQRKELEETRTEKTKFETNSKGLYAEKIELRAKLENLEKERDALKEELSVFKAEDKRRLKEQDQKLQQLNRAEEAFKEERQRVIREDEERRILAETERDRIWNDHENDVIAQLSTFCKMPQLSFTHYTNNNLPDGFDGSLKPDFMIDFLGQYVIFDAKASKAESLQTYINNTVKKTVEKMKKNPQIASTIYLVVPTQAIHELKNHYYPLDGYSVYVICPQSIGPILAALKKITTYELAEQLDPQKRENIINLLSELDLHVNMRNSVDIALSQLGSGLIEKAQNLDPELAEEVSLKKQEKIKELPNLMNSTVKKMIASVKTQNEAIEQLIAPKAAIKVADLESATEIVMQRLL